MPTVRIQVIKVYDVEVGGADPIGEAYELSTVQIEQQGKLVDASTDFAEVIEEEK